MGNKLKILFIATCPYYFIRGKSLRVHANVLALRDLGHEITVVAYDNGSNPDVPDIAIHRAPALLRMRNPRRTGPSLTKILSDIAISRLASNILKQECHDLIVGADFEGAMIAIQLKKKFALPVVIDIHGRLSELFHINAPWSKILPVSILDRIEKQVWNRADALVCNWPQVEQYTKKILPHIFSTIVLDVPAPSHLPRGGKPTPSGKPGIHPPQTIAGKKVILYAGNFSAYQNFNLAIQGFQRALQRGLTDAVVLVVGADYQHYAATVKKLGIERHFIFVGEKTVEETTAFMQLADIGLTLIPHGGNPPSKILHYHLAGCPILACDSPAHRTLLTDGLNAVFCENNPEHFAKKMCSLLEDTSLQKRLANTGLQQAQSCTPQAAKDRWAETMDRILR